MGDLEDSAQVKECPRKCKCGAEPEWQSRSWGNTSLYLDLLSCPACGARTSASTSRKSEMKEWNKMQEETLMNTDAAAIEMIRGKRVRLPEWEQGIWYFWKADCFWIHFFDGREKRLRCLVVTDDWELLPEEPEPVPSAAEGPDYEDVPVQMTSEGDEYLVFDTSWRTVDRWLSCRNCLGLVCETPEGSDFVWNPFRPTGEALAILASLSRHENAEPKALRFRKPK